MARVLLEFTHSSTDGTWNRASILHWSPSRYRYKDRAAVNPRNQISEKGNGKAPETDEISAEVLKVEEYGDAYVAILKISHDILSSQNMPEHWKTGLFKIAKKEIYRFVTTRRT